MASVKEHYDSLLSEIYTWLLGGFSEAKNRNTEFFKSKNIIPNQSGVAIDLGAGSGFQSIPLAEIGFSVTAIDLNEALLQELCSKAQSNKGSVPFLTDLWKIYIIYLFTIIDNATKAPLFLTKYPCSCCHKRKCKACGFCRRC